MQAQVLQCFTMFIRVQNISNAHPLVAYCFIKCYQGYDIEFLKRKPSLFLEQT